MELYTIDQISSQIPVMELKNAMDLDNLMFRRERFSLPCGEINKQKGFLFYTLNTSIGSIASLLKNENKIILNRANSYNSYYYDYTLLRNSLKIGNIVLPTVTFAKAKSDRLIRYNQMKTSLEGVRTPINSNTLRGKNFVCDLDPIIELMKNEPKVKKISLTKKIILFFDTIKRFTEVNYYANGDTGQPYTKGPIFINLDDMKNHSDISDFHFLKYLIMLFKKSETFMSKFSAKYKVVFYTTRGYLVFDMEKDLQKRNLSKLKFSIARLKPEINTSEVESIVVRDELAEKMNSVNGFTGEDKLDHGDGVVDAVAKSMKLDDSENVEEELDSKLDTDFDINTMDDESKKEYYDMILKKKTGYSSKEMSPRDKLLREKQKDIKIKNATIGELTSDIDIPEIPSVVVNPQSDLKVINENITDVKFTNFQKIYNEELFERHIAEVVTSFNDKSINVNVLNVEVNDISDNLNMIEQYTIQLEDEMRRRHTMKINVPKIIDGRFLYLNGNKKTIQKQFMGMPVIKTGPDVVQICTNYNKIFIYRRGTRFNPNMEKLRKYITKPENLVKVVRGSNVDVNKNYITCLEYDQLAETYSSIEIGKCKFIFNAKELEDIFGGKYKSTTDSILIGIKTVSGKKEPIYYKLSSEDHPDIVSTMIHEAKPDDYDEFKKLSFGKKYTHTEAKVLTKFIPVVVLIMFFEGITKVIQKFGDKNVRFTDKRSNQDNNMYIQFADGYLCYPMSDIEACMMFNGLTEIPTSMYTIAEMDDRETYLSIFEHLYGSGYIAGALVNYYDFMIDPITLKILRMLNYPEDIVSLIIYANNLLADNDYKSDMNLSMYRLRDMEIIPAIMYKQMTVAYSRYRATANNKNPIKMTVDPDCVVKALNNLPTVESYSKLSPILEVRNDSLASMVGVSGMNEERAYTPEKRVFDDSMLGVVGVSTDIAGNCGKERHLVLEPSVVNALGMMELHGKERADELKDVNLLTSVEMLCPGGVRHDDPVRTAMATKQSGHTIPVAKQSPLLVSNGVDSTIQYRTCDDFSVVAEEDGEVIDLNDKLEIMMVKYKSGKTKAIDLSPSIAKNGGGGFYLKNKLDSSFRKGDKFKKDAILAFDKSFYKDAGVFGNKLIFGTLVKSAIVSNGSTYEDSTWVTHKLSEDMATDITMMKSFVVMKNSSVDFVVKRGDKVKIGDDLIRFDTSYDEDELNSLLANIRDDMHEEIINIGKTKITSKYTGVIEDVVVYPTIPLDEMTPSLRKVVENVQKDIRDKKKYLDKYEPESKGAVYRMGVLLDKPDGIIEPDRYGKLKGIDAEGGVLFEIYITYHDELSDGDKLTHMTANKATIGYVVPRGFEPYTEFRPYEEVSIPIAPSAILQRGTPSIKLTMCYYKVLIELKRKWYEILTGESWNEKQKRENAYMLKPESLSESVSVDNPITPVMEVAFDLHRNDKGHYCTSTIHSPGDVIMPVSADDIKTRDAMVNEFRLDGYGDANITYNEELNVLEAIQTIYPGELLIL